LGVARSPTRLAVAVFVLLAGGCQDIRNYRGTWSGAISTDPDRRVGFDVGQRATLAILSLDHGSVHGRLTAAPVGTNAFVDSIVRVAGDELADISVGADSLRNYLAFLPTLDGVPALGVITLRANDAVELRIIRGTNELYGVFPLSRTQ
jgi:hypothetical protein